MFINIERSQKGPQRSWFCPRGPNFAPVANSEPSPKSQILYRSACLVESRSWSDCGTASNYIQFMIHFQVWVWSWDWRGQILEGAESKYLKCIKFSDEPLWIFINYYHKLKIKRPIFSYVVFPAIETDHIADHVSSVRRKSKLDLQLVQTLKVY